MLVLFLLVMEWKGIRSSGPAPKGITSTNHALSSSVGRLAERPVLPSAVVSLPAGSSKTTMPERTSAVSQGPQHAQKVVSPVDTPTIYANPEILGEVSPYHEEMYGRVMSRFSSRMSRITSPPDSPEYRRAFEEASRDADNALRALMGHDAYIRLKAASQKGQTVR